MSIDTTSDGITAAYVTVATVVGENDEWDIYFGSIENGRLHIGTRPKESNPSEP